MVNVKEVLRRKRPFFAEFRPQIEDAIRDFENRAKSAPRDTEGEEYSSAKNYLNSFLRKAQGALKSLNGRGERLWGMVLYSYENVPADALNKIARGQDMTPLEYGAKLASDRLLLIFGVPEQVVKRKFDRGEVEQMEWEGTRSCRETEIEPRVLGDKWTVFVPHPTVFVELYYRKSGRYPFQCNLMFDLAGPVF